jgi:CopG family nickel-responsive transcriptional regulator
VNRLNSVMSKRGIIIKTLGMPLSMKIVSVSLPDDLVTDMDRLIETKGYRGRSELVRTAIRQMAHDVRQGGPHIHGSITISYAEGKEARISEARHAYHDVVLSLMHTHCEDDVCMDVLIVGGKADRILALTESLRRMRDVGRCQLVQVSGKA